MNLIQTVEKKVYTLDEAFEYCAGVTNSHYENFPVASLFLPEGKRHYLQAIYAFSRIADDFADEGGIEPSQRLELLNDWEHKLVRCYEGEAEHPVFIALNDTVNKLNIPIEPLRDLLTAFKQDVSQSRYETFEELLGYCCCSANPVGRLVLMIFGYRHEDMYKLSDNICTALQLANFWQDISVDVLKDRLYLPLEDMRRYGVSVEDWKQGANSEKFKELIKFEVERTREMFFAGSELPEMVDRDLQLELKLVWFGGMGILKKIERMKFQVQKQRPHLTTMNKIMILLKGLFINSVSTYGRKKEELY